MNKKVKFLIAGIILMTITLIAYKINASEKINVVDYTNNDSSSTVLYENGDLFLWNETDSYKLENVKALKNFLNRGVLVHYNDGKIEMFNSYQIRKLLFENVKKLDKYYYVTNDDSLYAYADYFEGPSFVDVSISNQISNLKIFDNIKSYKSSRDYNSVLILINKFAATI